jgi:septin family protein
MRSWPSSCLTSGPVPYTGESGLGKSTLINSLFLTNLYEDRQVPDASGKSTPSLHRLPIPTAVLASLCAVPGLFLCYQAAFFFFLSGDFGGLWFSLRWFPPLKTHVGMEPCFRALRSQFSVPIARTAQTLTIERRGVEIEEGGIKVKLTLVDTPGFGDSVDCSDW